MGVEEVSTHLATAAELRGSSRRSAGLVLGGGSAPGGAPAAQGAESSESSMRDFAPHVFFGCIQYLPARARTAVGGATRRFPDVYWRPDM